MQPTPIRDACVMRSLLPRPLSPSLPKPFPYRKRLKLDVMALAVWPVGLQKSLHPPVPVLACLSWPGNTVLQDLHVGFAALPVHPSTLHSRRSQIWQVKDVVFGCNVSRTFVV